MQTGRELRAGVVVSNADPKHTLLVLVHPDDLPADYVLAIDARSTDVSYLKFHSVMGRLPDISAYLGRQATPREASSIHIAPSLASFRRAHGEASAGLPAAQPIVHIQIPTVYDDTLSSEAGYLVSLWALYAPPALAGTSWDEAREAIGEALIDYVSALVPDFRADMREWLLLTPQDLEARVGLTAGNIRHLDMIPSQLLARRPLSPGGYDTPIRGLLPLRCRDSSGWRGHRGPRSQCRAIHSART